MEATLPARWGLKILRALGWSFTLRKLDARWNPSGPRGLDLSLVRNEKGEVITFDLYHEVLAVRRQVVKEWRESGKIDYFFEKGKKVEMIEAFLGMKVAEAITPAVYLAHYAFYFPRQEKQGEREKQEKVSWNTLVIPASAWSEILKRELKQRKLVNEVFIDKKTAFKENSRFLFYKHILRALWNGGWKKSKAEAFNGVEPRPGQVSRVMVNYRMGLLESERNDMAFFHASNMATTKLVIYCKSERFQPSGAEAAWVKQNQVCCFVGPGMEVKDDGVHTWIATGNYQKWLKAFYKKFTGAFFQVSGKWAHEWWVLEQFWTLGIETAAWQDFFTANGVKVLVNSIPSDTNFIPNIAIDQVGGLAVELERSIRFDYCTYIHNSPNHLYFATGPYSLTQVPEKWYSQVIVETGGINIQGKDVKIDGYEKLKERSPLVIGVFDELSNDWFFGESVRMLYELLIELLNQDDRFSLLIKTKKPQVLESLGSIKAGIERLSGEGRCLSAPWRMTPATVAIKSNMVVCVPSTAAFESVMTHTPTVVFNPMRKGSRVFYGNGGFNRRVFEEQALMIKAMIRFADGDKAIGDYQDILPLIDPFGDGKGAERMGHFIGKCLEGFDQGLTPDEVIAEVSDWYRKEWGKERVTRTAEN